MCKFDRQSERPGSFPRLINGSQNPIQQLCHLRLRRISSTAAVFIRALDSGTLLTDLPSSHRRRHASCRADAMAKRLPAPRRASPRRLSITMYCNEVAKTSTQHLHYIRQMGPRPRAAMMTVSEWRRQNCDPEDDAPRKGAALLRSYEGNFRLCCLQSIGPPTSCICARSAQLDSN